MFFYSYRKVTKKHIIKYMPCVNLLIATSSFINQINTQSKIIVQLDEIHKNIKTK